jgi:hypothetical protein
MRNMTSMLLVLLLFLVVQTTWAPAFISYVARLLGSEALFSTNFDVALVMLIYLVVRRDLLGAFLWTSMLGILLGSFGLAWKGAQVVSYFFVALCGQISRRALMVEGILGFMGLVFVFTLVEGVVHLNLGATFNDLHSVFSGQFWPLWWQACFNTLISPIAFLMLSLLDRWTMERQQRPYGLTPL